MIIELPKNWKCYICGKKIGSLFFLLSSSKSSDRVFLGCSIECVRTTKDAYFMEVKENDIRM